MIAALLLALPAQAHIELTFPQTRYGDPDFQKDGQCGRGLMDQRSVNNVTVFEPGETIDVTWSETVNHTSHFRISFDEDGTDFVDPPQEDSYFSNLLVVADNIPDEPSQTYVVPFTFPLVECTNCTLQVIQVMHEGPYAPGTDDIYYNCADIELAFASDTDTDTDTDTDDTDTDPVDTGTPPPPPPPDTDDTDPPVVADPPAGDGEGKGCAGGCAGTSSAGGSMALAAVALLLGTRRRRPAAG